jgi:hypothetical protein
MVWLYQTPSNLTAPPPFIFDSRFLVGEQLWRENYATREGITSFDTVEFSG